ncbi:hypothetical protein SR41_16570 [Sphingomonas melonis]|uniref:Nucleotidyl transferase AbiEii/AbiGii toxin family protein n=1 Tax=Sphingomonas melonis TaxID=152682 RepID=A0A0D1KNE2_9SPHN|nr:hypothetical protein SR41_16570 [Sphingomonas melonis]
MVYDLASILTLSDNAFIVGGQALNLWAERYSHVAQLADYGPYTSKDLDYFGHREAAQKLADALGGTVSIPKTDDHTPQTAIVTATIHGETVEIDFLYHVKGVNPQSLQKQAVQLVLSVRVGEGTGTLYVPIMHPLHCMQSRLANVVDLGRRTDLAKRQLEASSVVLAEYLSERLRDGSVKHVMGVLQALHQYLLTDPTGKKAHHHMSNDPAAILDRFMDDERLDERWRQLTLKGMRTRVHERRTAWGAMKARAKGVVSAMVGKA